MFAWPLCALGAALTLTGYYGGFQSLYTVLTATGSNSVDQISAGFLHATMYWAAGSLCMIIGVILIARTIPMETSVADDPGHVDTSRLHASALCYLIGIPQGQLLGPVIVGNFVKFRNSTGRKQLKSILNFQLSITLYAFVAALMGIVVIGIVFLAVLFVFQFAITLRAASNAKHNRSIRYPLSLPFLK